MYENKENNMGSFLNALKKTIFVEEENSSVEQKEEKQQNVVVVPQQSITPSPTGTDTGLELVDESLLEKFEAKLKAENIPGPDYLELKEAAESEDLVSMEPDEKKRYAQQYLSMKRFFPDAKISKISILGAIDHYTGVLEGERKVGMQELQKKRDLNVVQEQQEVDKLGEEISKLEAELAAKKQERDVKNAKIKKNKEDYDLKEAKFNATLGYMLNILAKDKEKINNYINE